MAGNSKINNLDPAAGLTGTEELPIVQAGETVKTTTQDIVDLVPTPENLGNENLIADANRTYTLKGSLASDLLTIKNGAGTDVLQFRGDSSVYIPTGVIGQGVLPNSAIGNSGNSGSTYGFYTSKSRTGADFLSFATTTPHKYSAARLNANQTGFYVDANQATTGNRQGAHLALYGSNTGNNIGLKLDIRSGLNNYALEVLDGDFKFGTGTGSKIGTATTEKIGFWNTTPIVQPTGLTTSDATATDGTVVTADIIINNLRTRLDELEARLSTASGGIGIIA